MICHLISSKHRKIFEEKIPNKSTDVKIDVNITLIKYYYEVYILGKQFCARKSRV